MLKSLGLGAAGFMLTPWNTPSLRAAPSKRPERYFVFCYFQGGWDITQSLDPRDPNKFSESLIRSTRIQLGWDRLPNQMFDGTRTTKDLIVPKGSNIDFGPAMKHFADAGHHDVTCLVRGITMDTVTHQVGRRYFITGMMPNGLNAKGSAVPTRIVAQEIAKQSALTAIPNLVVKVETFNQGDPASASGLKVSSVNDLLSTLQDGAGAPNATIRAALEKYRLNRSDCDPVALNDQGIFQLIKDAQVKARVLVSGGLREQFNFLGGDAAMNAIKDRYSITSNTSPEAQAAVAYQAIKNNIAQCVSIELAGGLDTHGAEWAEDHIDRLSRGFKALSTLVTDLKKTPHPDKPTDKLIDHTTIVCFSEFGRTAMINNRDGRDHTITNASLLIGAGVKHNAVIGGSSDRGMNPEAIDPITGAVAPAGGQLVTPSHVIASVMESAGYDTEALRVKGLPAIMDKRS